MSNFEEALFFSRARAITSGMRIATVAVLLMKAEIGPTVSMRVRSWRTSLSPARRVMRRARR